MLPVHVATTVERLRSVDFTHPLPVHVGPDGGWVVHPTDLADPRWRRWHAHQQRNAVGLSGVGHRLDAYRRLPHGWRTTPAGHWPDHYMWQQWFDTPGLTFATGDEITWLKMDTSLRRGRDGAARRAEMLGWLATAAEPGFDEWLRRQATQAMAHAAQVWRLEADRVGDTYLLERAAFADAQAGKEAELVRTQEVPGRHLAPARGGRRRPGRKEAELVRTHEVLADTRRQREEADAALAEADAERRRLGALEQSETARKAIEDTATWKLHDRLARSDVVRRLARKLRR